MFLSVFFKLIFELPFSVGQPSATYAMTLEILVIRFGFLFFHFFSFYVCKIYISLHRP